MPVVIHSKARLGQPTGLVASPRDGERNCPKGVVKSQQGNAVVGGHKKVGTWFPTWGQLKMLGTQMGYPIGVPIWILQKNKSIKIIDNVVMVINI